MWRHQTQHPLSVQVIQRTAPLIARSWFALPWGKKMLQPPDGRACPPIHRNNTSTLALAAHSLTIHCADFLIYFKKLAASARCVHNVKAASPETQPKRHTNLVAISNSACAQVCIHQVSNAARKDSLMPVSALRWMPLC